MKFCKKYEEYMERQERKLPEIGFRKLKESFNNGVIDIQISCPQNCPVCDGTFFPSLLKDMHEVIGFFNERAQKLLELHLASGLKKYFIWFKSKLFKEDHFALIQEGRDLITYALINAIAIRKILKKYDKFYCSKQGQAFKSQAQSMHIEILQSPWLYELMAFHINMRETMMKSSKFPAAAAAVAALFEDFSLALNDANRSLSCELFDSIRLDLDLTCSICLDTVFDPVSLACGHILCYMCACTAASVSIVDGLKSAEPKEKCPLCREAGVYEGAIQLQELNILLSRSYREYWVERLQAERIERVRQAKEHWESQCRAFMGI